MERIITFINPIIPLRNVALWLLSPIPTHAHPQNIHTLGFTKLDETCSEEKRCRKGETMQKRLCSHCQHLVKQTIPAFTVIPTDGLMCFGALNSGVWPGQRVSTQDVGRSRSRSKLPRPSLLQLLSEEEWLNRRQSSWRWVETDVIPLGGRGSGVPTVHYDC